MIHSFDTIDYAAISLIIVCVFLFIVGFIVSIFESFDAKNKDKEITLSGCLGGIGLFGIPMTIIIFMITIAFNSVRDISEEFTNDSTIIRVETVKTSPYKTVYRNNEDINVSIEKTLGGYVTLPAIFHQVSIDERLVDKDLKVVNQFTFSKNKAQRTSERLTETIVAKDSPFTENDPRATKRVDKVEFTTRTYRFSTFGYHVERTEPIARVTVSYQLDTEKVQTQADNDKIDKLIGADSTD